MASNTLNWILGTARPKNDESSAIVVAADAHNFADGEIKVVSIDDARTLDGSFYAQRIGSGELRLYLDEEFTKPVVLTQHLPVRMCLPRPDDYAIVVGINKYTTFKELGGPETDGRAFARWLLSGDGGCLSRANVYEIYQPEDKRKPTLSEVNLAFRIFSGRAVATIGHKVGRRFYIFLAGHGITPLRAAMPIVDDTALLMADADHSDLPHLAGLGYAEWFRTAGAFDEIILFTDCCRDQKTNVVPNVPAFPITFGDRDRVKVLYAAATGLNSKAWERDLGDPPTRRGIFSYVLMQALEMGAARDTNGRLTARSLKMHLENGVQQLKAEQRPKVFHDAPESDDIVFLEKPADGPPNVTFSFSEKYHGASVRLIGSKYPKEDQELTAGPGPIRTYLPFGLYKLIVEGGPSRLFEVRAGRTDVEL
jgi:hypothetical protein